MSAEYRVRVTNRDNRLVNAWCGRCGGRFAEHPTSKTAWCEECIAMEEPTLIPDVTKGA